MDLARLERQARTVRLPVVDAGRELRAGRHRTVHRGQGFLFTDSREYQYGDEIRNLDWNVTARLGKPFVKLFEQERGSGVLLVLDLSASLVGTGDAGRKARLVREVAVLLALAARHQGERLGALLCTGQAERIIPPRRGHDHTQVVIGDLRRWQPGGRGTGLGVALTAARRVMQRPGLVIILSDFLDREYAPALRALSARHDILPLCVKDPAEATLPRAGLVRYRDPESGASRLVDTSSTRVRLAYEKNWKALDAARKAIFDELGLPDLELEVGQPYVPVINGFAGRRQG